MNIDITGNPVITLSDSYNGVVFKSDNNARVYIRRVADAFALTMTTKGNINKNYVIDFETGEMIKR